MSNVSARTINDSEGISRFSLAASFKEDIVKQKMALTLNVKNEHNNDYDKQLLRTDIESCSKQKGGFSMFFVPLIQDFVAQYSNIKEVCPLKKGYYYMENFGIPGEVPWPSFLPKTFGAGGLRWEAIVDFKGRVAKSKALTHGLTLKLYGTSVY